MPLSRRIIGTPGPTMIYMAGAPGPHALEPMFVPPFFRTAPRVRVAYLPSDGPRAGVFPYGDINIGSERLSYHNIYDFNPSIGYFCTWSNDTCADISCNCDYAGTLYGCVLCSLIRGDGLTDWTTDFPAFTAHVLAHQNGDMHPAMYPAPAMFRSPAASCIYCDNRRMGSACSMRHFMAHHDELTGDDWSARYDSGGDPTAMPHVPIPDLPRPAPRHLLCTVCFRRFPRLDSILLHTNPCFHEALARDPDWPRGAVPFTLNPDVLSRIADAEVAISLAAGAGAEDPIIPHGGTRKKDTRAVRQRLLIRRADAEDAAAAAAIMAAPALDDTVPAAVASKPPDLADRKSVV